MSFKLYDQLGLARGASKEDIKRAYKALAIQHHPDKGGDPEKFKEISNAYQVLNDDEKRARYDQVGDAGMDSMAGHPGGFEASMDPRHIFEQFFGGGGGGFHFDMFGRGDHFEQARPARRGDQLHTMRVPLRDAFHGLVKTIRINLQKTCMRCKEVCHACQGRGSITVMRRMGPFTQMMTQPCDVCKGSGQITRGKEDCPDCKGKGTFTEEKKLEIEIPKGVSSGYQIRVPGCGEQARSPDETPGDLILQFMVQEDPHFQRNGHDLFYRTKLTFAETILGKNIVIPHFAGDMQLDTSRFGVIQPEKAYTIEGKGMPMESSGKHYGKLHVIFQVDYPTVKWTEEQKEVWKVCLNTVGLTSSEAS
jgi:DnaJ homolog subfamily A member 2